MIDDDSGSKRYVGAYSKIYDEYGNADFIEQYELKPLNLSFLHKLFNVESDKKDLVSYYMINDYNINEEQASALQPYVIGGTLDLKKYDYLLECYDASECKHSEEYLKSIK